MNITPLPRGIRNNNPLNIRVGNSWLGEVREPTDNVFEQFCHITYGLRAAFILLRRYINRYKLNTIEKIITRWAPSNENNTKSYIAHVSQGMQLDPNTPIRYEDKITMCRLVYEMAFVENGQRVTMTDIARGYEMAECQI